ncbi:helix-turn-helix transcriptional regulator [Streptomyces qinzhouensis]|uniref:helix-turn-helix transcriptional regulator n=1 Tax=Streptomyces qinzhouensis TaxID=2599401 RepID=UPI001FEC54EC|nr:LuxR family transcriptional regulator [Streptomyces qinzhouensis]
MERSEILEELGDLLARSARGRGAIASISGSTAMGKTAVLNVLADQASSAGSTVLGVVSTPDEREHAFSGLAQLFQAVHAHAPEAAGGGVDLPGGVRLGGPAGVAVPPASGVAQDELVAVARQTHRVVAALAARGHVLITVDDIQHTDAATLFCIRYLAQRLPQLPVTLVLTRGTLLVDEQSPRVLDDLVYKTSVRRFHLGPLSREGVRELAASLVPFAPPDDFVAELHRLSMGNPLLVQAVVEDGLRAASESAAARVLSGADDHGGRPDPGDRLSAGHVFQQVVLTCLHRLGPHAERVARCVALLDRAATTLLLSRLSGIEAELVRRCLRLLTGIGVLDGTRLRHPGMRQALLREMSPDEATELRHRAARLLYDDGAPPQAVAVHLLGSGPLREGWVVPVLQEAARQALADGEVAQGLRCLELARDCCSEEAERLSVMSQYAYGQWQLRPAHSAQHFLALKNPITAGKLACGDALRVAEGMMFYLHFDEAMKVVDHQNGDEGAVTALHGTRLLMASEFLGLLDRPARPLPKVQLSATSTSEVRARHALVRALGRGADEDAIALAEQVLQGSHSPEPWKLDGFQAALLTLCYTDRLDAARKWYEVLAADSGRYEAPGWRGLLESTGALISLRRGQLADAVRQAETARARLSGRSWNVGSASALAVLIEALTAMGDHEAVVKLLAVEPPQALFQTRAGLHYLYARGRHHVATGKLNMALTDFLGCGTLMQRWNVDTPALAPWRLGAAEVWMRLGDRERAARLVEKQFAATEAGLTRSRGMVLHSLALLQPAAKQPPILLDAFDRLDNSGAWYEAASVLVDLSRAYQQLGETAVARQTARRAWRLARSCRAESLCQSLLPTKTPRVAEAKKPASPGGGHGGDQFSFDRLSESERRVAILATQGYANREIADRLYITVSTVEQHLTRVYRKLGIRNREQLLDGDHAVPCQAV